MISTYTALFLNKTITRYNFKDTTKSETLFFGHFVICKFKIELKTASG